MSRADKLPATRTRAIPRPAGEEAPEDRPPVAETPALPLPAKGYNPAVRARARATSYVTAPVEPLPDSDPLLGFAPVPHVAPRRNSITPDRQRAFIAHLAATGIVKQAALHIGASLEALYKLRQRPGAEGFCSAWDRAVDYGVQRLEDCALARAIEGEERLVVSSGQLIGTERRHNEALVMFFLRHRRAERYAAEIRPGHPLYERVRAELLVELEREFALRAEEDEEEVLASLTAKLEDMRNRQIAADALRAELGLGPEEDEA